MLRQLFLVVILFCAGGHLHAQDSVAPPSDPVVLRSFDAERIRAYQADPAYEYEREVHREPSPWERFKQWLNELLRRILGSGPGDLITRNLLYILIVVALVFAIIMLSKGGLRRVFHGAPRSLSEVAVVEEDIRGMDLPTMIAEAEMRGDLRRAIRLHYLLVLRKLVDEGVLHWGPALTDRDYMAQINDPVLHERFVHAARVFQWVWYGHAALDRYRYEQLRQPFVEFELAPAA